MAEVENEVMVEEEEFSIEFEPEFEPGEDGSKGVFSSKTMIAAVAEAVCGVLLVFNVLTMEQAASLQPFIGGLALWGLRTAGVPLKGFFGKSK